MAVTLLLLGALGLIFLKGFREAIWLAVALVALYLGLNLIVIGRELAVLVSDSAPLAVWRENLFRQESSDP